MGIKENGIAFGRYAVSLGEKVIGFEAFKNTSVDKPVTEALACGAIQLLLPVTNQKVKLVDGGKTMGEQMVDENASLPFAFEITLNLGLGFLAGYWNLGWKVAIAKLGINMISQIAPDVVRLFRKGY